jgi:mRNA-degrading endonuclease toxin of MazEF toxin-antitoxin module
VSVALQQGQIVRATIPDPQGRNWKRRPVVIFSDAEAIAAGEIDVIAITTQVGSFPPEVSVPIPWQRGGHPRTTLTQPNEAICVWTARISAADVEAPKGRVPLAEMTRILAILANLQAPPQPPPAAPE